MRRHRPAIYLAGPMTKPDLMENVAYGMKVGKQMARDGFAPYIPMLDAFMHFEMPAEYELLLEWDFAWIERADGLYRLRGESPGADREVEFAKSLAIPVYFQEDKARKHTRLHSDLGYAEMLRDFGLGGQTWDSLAS